MSLVKVTLIYYIIFPDELSGKVPTNTNAASSESKRKEKTPKPSDRPVARRLKNDALSNRNSRSLTVSDILFVYFESVELEVLQH